MLVLHLGQQTNSSPKNQPKLLLIGYLGYLLAFEDKKLGRVKCMSEKLVFQPNQSTSHYIV